MFRLRIGLAFVGVCMCAGMVLGGTVKEDSLTSTALNKTVKYWVYLPSNYEAEVAAGKKFSVVYLLHWWLYYADGWHNPRDGRTNPRLDRMIDSVAGIICVSPQAGDEWWIDRGNNRLGTFLKQDLRNEINSKYATNTDAANTGICGISMGGFGALHHVRVNKDIYGVGFAIAALTDLSINQRFPLGMYYDHCGWSLCNVFGTGYFVNNDILSQYSPMANIEGFRGLKIGFYTGSCAVSTPGCPLVSPDFFLDENVKFHEELTKANIPHVFHNFTDDGHEYPTPEKMVMVLKFFAENFGLEPVSVSRKPITAAIQAGMPKLKINVVEGKTTTIPNGRNYVGIDGRAIKAMPKSGIVIKAR